MRRRNFDIDFSTMDREIDEMLGDMDRMMSEIDRGFPLPRGGKMRGSYSSTVIVNGKVVSHEEGSYDNDKDPEVITVTAKKGDAPPVTASIPAKELEAEEAKGGGLFDRMERLMSRIFNAVRGKPATPEIKAEAPAPKADVKAEAPVVVPELPAPKPVLMLPAPAPEAKAETPVAVAPAEPRPANDEKPAGPDKKIMNFKI